MAAKKKTASTSSSSAAKPKFGSAAWNAKYHIKPFTKKTAKTAAKKPAAKKGK